MASSRFWILTPRSGDLKNQPYRRVKKIWLPEPPSLLGLPVREMITPRQGQPEGHDGPLHDRPVPAASVLLWPTELSIAGASRIPGIPRSELSGAVAGELEPLLPWNIEDCQIAIHATRIPQGWDVYAWATPRRWLENALTALAGYGIDPKHIIPETAALLAFRASDPTPRPRTEFLLATGENRHLVMTIRDGLPLRESVVTITPDAKGTPPWMDFLVASAIMDSPDKAFLWTGPGRDENLGDWRNPVLPDPERQEEERNAMAIAQWIGKNGSTPPPPDFRNGSLAFRKDREDLFQHSRNLGIVAMVLVALILADAWLHVRGLENRVKQTRKVLDSLAEKILAPGPVVEPLSQLSARKNTLEKQKRILSRGSDIIAILKDIAGAPEPDIPFELVSLSIGKKSVTISGKTVSFQNVDRIRASLMKTPHIRSLVVQSARLDIDRKTVAFRLGGTHD